LTQHRTYSNETINTFNGSVVITIPTEFPGRPGTTIFLIRGIIEDEFGFNGTKLYQGYYVEGEDASRWVIIKWDRLIVQYTTDTGETIYDLGESIDITLDVYYESNKVRLTSSDLIYNITKDGLLFATGTGLSLSFSDFEGGNRSHTYKAYVYDSRTNLTGSYSVIKPRVSPASITISWYDRYSPRILDYRMIDYGNGVLGFLVVVTDDFPEFYNGTGIDNVSVQITVEGAPGPSRNITVLKLVQNTSLGLVYYGTRSTVSDPEANPRDYFAYNQVVKYQIRVTDKHGNWLAREDSAKLEKDSDLPEILNLDIVYSRTIDGGFSIVVVTKDNWSGLSNASIRFFDPLLNKWMSPELMEVSENNTVDKSVTFYLNFTFDVGRTFSYELTVFDVSGNRMIVSDDLFILDKSGPQLLEGSTFEYTQFGDFVINIITGDNGSDIKQAILYYQFWGDEESQLYQINLSSLVKGGGGSALDQGSYVYTRSFSQKFHIAVDFSKPKPTIFKLVLIDSEGNIREIPHSVLAGLLKQDATYFEIPSLSMELLQNPIFLFIVFILIIAAAFIAVRRLRTISGFDRSKIMEDLVRIPDNEVWEENDNISIGIYANFFDQIRGPVPIVWYPERAEQPERIRYALADRSFSTLGFVPKPDEVKDATFRFTYAGEKCTVFAYAFAIENPEARGGQENLSLCFMIRPPWGNLENINKFRVELLEHFQRISELMKKGEDPKIVQREMQKTREFFTKAMLTFRRKYRREFVE